MVRGHCIEGWLVPWIEPIMKFTSKCIWASSCNLDMVNNMISMSWWWYASCAYYSQHLWPLLALAYLQNLLAQGMWSAHAYFISSWWQEIFLGLLLREHYVACTSFSDELTIWEVHEMISIVGHLWGEGISWCDPRLLGTVLPRSQCSTLFHNCSASWGFHSWRLAQLNVRSS